jgi:hypothetical protein
LHEQTADRAQQVRATLLAGCSEDEEFDGEEAAATEEKTARTPLDFAAFCV